MTLRLEPAPIREWVEVVRHTPPIYEEIGRPKLFPYVLAIDAEDRQSVGYVRSRYSTGELWWVFAKPIGTPTHWMPLPLPPKRG